MNPTNMSQVEIEKANNLFAFSREKAMLEHMPDGERKVCLMKLALAYSNGEYNLKYIDNLKKLLQVVIQF